MGVRGRDGAAHMRLVPDGMAGRLALLLGASLLVANAVALALLSFERVRLGTAATHTRALERLVDAVPRLDDASFETRAEVSHRLERSGVRGGIAPRPLLRRSGGPRGREIARRVRARLGDGRRVRAAIVRLPRDPGTERRAWGGPRQRLQLSIGLLPAAGKGAAWLNVTMPPPTRSAPRGPVALALFVGLSLAAVLGVALLYVRRLVHPLRELATAARAAGNGDRTARVAETGERELREAAGAFNDMQSRIARFESERTRTLAAVGHDLRTPITSLRIRAEMLEDDAREPMVRTLDEMRVMADGLVAYARGEGDAEAAEPVDLAATLERLCAERGAEWAGAGAGRVSDPPLIARARPVALARAVGNLVDNALRYGGTARVSLGREGGEAVIAIEDGGPGIAPERLEAVMEPFVRGEASRSAETGGAGLGLSIARAVLASHGGSLALRNRPQGGLRAEARLPLAGAPGRG